MTYVVTGVTGRTGAVAARTLLAAGERVRVVVRNPAHSEHWERLGAEVAVADLTDAAALTRAFSRARGAYLVSPPSYALKDIYRYVERVADAAAQAAEAARLPKLVLLSSVGADQASGIGVIANNRTMEQRLSRLDIPMAFLRAAYFMENWAGMVDSVLNEGILPSFLAPLDRAIPMVATRDIGRVAAETLREDWSGTRTVALEGPAQYSPNEIAAAFEQALGRPVRAVIVEESSWRGALAQGGRFSETALAGFIEMTRSLNNEHISFASDTGTTHVAGSVPFSEVAPVLLGLRPAP
ncbi:NAD-dependent epimerase/dehydratase family protein [Burkholderia sp. Bp8963]|uniref:NmrA family NAD(P)-binding protein n=1 Tax=Burkholderia sp. Bp8963 TaxID=2184547 RepID=UPI000F59BC7F|nr:NmrA family NAD(P)-binding protein [Burkholderia sp. Bp8963]RQS69783.1 NAD-dependent epimerase/dehydratase family protein [Burkholderia sp. Bp8963]